MDGKQAFPDIKKNTDIRRFPGDAKIERKIADDLIAKQIKKKDYLELLSKRQKQLDNAK